MSSTFNHKASMEMNFADPDKSASKEKVEPNKRNHHMRIAKQYTQDFGE